MEEGVLRMSLLSLDPSVGDVAADDGNKCCGSASTTSDSLSTTSEEGGVEAGLPRIIKSRKRRKRGKNTTNCHADTNETKKRNRVCPEGESERSFVTLKPYVPASEGSSERSDEEAIEELEEGLRMIKVSGEEEQQGDEEEGEHMHMARVCGCQKCMPAHSFPTPPSSPSSSTSRACNRKPFPGDSLMDADALSSSGPSSSASDAEEDSPWSPSISSKDKQALIRSHSEPTSGPHQPGSPPSYPHTPAATSISRCTPHYYNYHYNHRRLPHIRYNDSFSGRGRWGSRRRHSMSSQHVNLEGPYFGHPMGEILGMCPSVCV